MHQAIVDLRAPVLRTESGAVLARFSSATVVRFEEGGCDLHTEPQLLPDDFPRGAYDAPNAAPLYLDSEDGTYKVRIRGGLLELA
jgi:hypothetical protein